MTPPYVVPARPAVLPGYLDIATRRRIAGWAQAAGAQATQVQAGGEGSEPAALQVLDNGRLIARVIANQSRPDLQQAGFGDGRLGFDLLIPAPLSAHERHIIQVRREADGTELIGSPVVLEATGTFDDDLRELLRQVAGGAQTNPERENILSFLAQIADDLLTDHARADGGQEQHDHYRRLARRHGPEIEEKPRAPRALLIDERLPVAGQDAGSQALLSHARALQALGYEVSLVAADDLSPPADARHALEAEGFTIWRAPHYASVEEILRRQSGAFDLVYLHRIGTAARYLSLARHHQPGAMLLYSVADLHHLRIAGQAEIEKRPELHSLSRRTRLQECTAAWQADAVLTHSPTEAAWLRQAVPQARVACVPWAIRKRDHTPDVAARRHIAFIGNYRHAPNLDAALWFVRDVLPELRVQNPELELWLVGPHLPPHLSWPEGVRVMGHVADLDGSVFEHVRLTVAPLKFGAGIKGKVVESLLAGIPCVMTSVAAEGLNLPASLTGLVADDAASQVACIRNLYAAPEECRRLGELAQAYVAETFSADHTLTSLRKAIMTARHPR
ncbi:glycosyltransferase [Gluconobacter sp. Dm-62]|uniref:glycosyltransferase family 4 protein n=1 Tax=Gluconobacter sp. Dm-62 TaxID=2799804 RepID=UPI001B8ABCC6|nr:glycosyltransferase family 4 protein [Gluconobacter sp. Dm-62]MBS1103125.1 glycosyltransferase [Gluconobacter sp. Dm-62]